MAQNAICATALLGVLLVLGLRPAQASRRFNFTDCGGASTCLGAKLPRIAARSQHRSTAVASADALAAALDLDADLGVDLTHEQLVFQCKGLVAPAPDELRRPRPGFEGHGRLAAAQDALLPALGMAMDAAPVAGLAVSTSDPPVSFEEAFSLHSRPGAPLKILLDFDGHVTAGTAWNTRQLPTIITPPFDKDGNTSNWSAAELADILAIWRAVAEDYAAWPAVDVTTEDPGASVMATQGLRAAIGGSSTDWYGSAGGVGYVNVFGQSFYQPCFVFPQQLGGGYAKYVWEAVSHEIGHNLGLSHDGNSTTGYYGGVSGGSWAPIMGVGYYKPITQFSKGEYAGANNKEDDIAIISKSLGPPTARPDQGNNSSATAVTLQGTPDATGLTATAHVSGTISGPSEDVRYSFNAAGVGSATLELLVLAPWGSTSRANLNVTLSLFSMQSATLTRLLTRAGTGIPAVTVALPSNGTFFVQLSSTGVGDPLTTGYTSYGSRGQYSLAVTYPSGVNTTSGNPLEPPPPSSAPSPSPSPSPPPSPPPPSMSVTGVSVSRKTSKGKALCTASVVVVDASTGARLAGVQVTGTWRSVLAVAPGWPHQAAGTASATGAATILSSATLPTARGNGCMFAVNAATKAGYAPLASTAAGGGLLSSSRTW